MFDENNSISLSEMTGKNVSNLSPKDKIKIYCLYKIANKKWDLGSTLEKDDIVKILGKTDNTAANLSREFMEGAQLMVNDVVIANKVPERLLDKYEVKTNG